MEGNSRHSPARKGARLSEKFNATVISQNFDREQPYFESRSMMSVGTERTSLENVSSVCFVMLASNLFTCSSLNGAKKSFGFSPYKPQKKSSLVGRTVASSTIGVRITSPIACRKSGNVPTAIEVSPRCNEI